MRFINGLQGFYSTEFVGRFFHRVLYEWLVQVIGWTVVDKAVGTKWDNVIASGSGTAQTTSSKLIQVTSAGYAFSKANEGQFLTITGFSGGDAEKDGIYKIRMFVGAVGSVYTLEVDWRQGVHSDGFPIQAGLNWRLWASNDTYCPSDNDIAVLGTKGTTGAGLTTGTRSGVALSISQVSTTSTLIDAGANFRTSDVGKQITVSGSAVSGNNGMFTIASRVSATQITYTNASGGNDSFTGSWSITYVVHVYLKVGTWNCGYGEIACSSFASWNAGSHAWSDSRYTASVKPTGGTTGQDRVELYASGDEKHFFMVIISDHTGSYPGNNGWVYQADELDTFYPENDPRPYFVQCGGEQSVYGYYSGGIYTTIGTNTDGTGSEGTLNFNNSVKSLAADNLTTLTYWMTFPHSSPSTTTNWMIQSRRLFSTFSGRFYRIPVIAECRTSGNMEMRGTFRNMWAVPVCLPLMYAYGANGEYLHAFRCISIPWNNARNPWPYIGHSQMG